MKNIYLIGHMGSGKSTLAPLLADYYNLSYKDTDKMVENMLGKEIPEIFEEYGEPQFRIYEFAAILQTTLTENLVVATGGGILKRPRNARYMKDYGTVIYLKVSVEEQYRRLTNDGVEKRPLIKGIRDLDKVLQDLHDKRNYTYQNTADFTVEVDGKTPREILNEVLVYLNKHVYRK